MIKMRNPTRIITDFDNDGVLNRFDCKPRNPRQQHIKPNIITLNRLKTLPIFFASGKLARYDGVTKYRELGDRWNKQILKIYHFTYKNMPFVQAMMPLMEAEADEEALKAERLRFKDKQLYPSGFRKILKLR